MRELSCIDPLRRTLLQALMACGVPLPFRAGAGSADEPAPPPTAFPVFLDTLLPADTTPSATQLDIDRVLLELARRQPALARLIGAGCDWLDAEARRHGATSFATLDAAGRERLAAAAERSPPASPPAAFFRAIQTLAFAHYYARPASWAGLGFAGPPQPVGFPDHAQPPAERS